MIQCVDGLLDLRNHCSRDQECWTHPAAKAALGDVINKIDNLLKQLNKS